MGKYIDLTGMRFGRLVVVENSHRDTFNKIRWKCTCDCGNETFVITSYLKSGATQSCGCMHKEVTSKRFKTHGSRNNPEYEVWASMVQRCTNPNNKRYDDYGGRGITINERWLSFESFLSDMGKRPSNKHSIERVDNNKGYSPENCKWATHVEQGRNKRPRKASVSGVTGVLWRKNNKKWIATITVNKKYMHIGTYTNKEDAIKARKEAEQKLWYKKPS